MRLTLHQATVGEAVGPLGAGSEVDVVLDQVSMLVSGGEPVTSWQIPLAATKDRSVVVDGETLVLRCRVAGATLALSSPSAALEGGTPEDVAALLGVTLDARAAPMAEAASSSPAPGLSPAVPVDRPVDPPVPSMTDPSEASTRPSGERRTQRGRIGWVLALVLVVAVIVAPIVVVLSRPSSTRAERAAERRAARSHGLQASDLSAGWRADSPRTSPLAGLLGTGPTRKETKAEHQAYESVLAEYRTCMGLTNATDREFGKAGVQPDVEVPSSPFGLQTNQGLIEAGTVSQRYATRRDVAQDEAQVRSARFDSCFASTLGRFVLIGIDPSSTSTPLPVTRQDVASSLGVYATGGSVRINVPSGDASVPVDLGFTLLMHDRDEVVLYTFSAPNRFPAQERQRLVDLLAARAAGIKGARAT